MSETGSDRFTGIWQVHEHVYRADGQLLGGVQQRRQLAEDPASGVITVTQDCRPSESLRHEPMGRFAGRFVFRLAKQGAQRLYLGPDVEGSATSWGDIYLAGAGLWPRFGFHFRSWSIRISSQRQLTGGVFYRGAETSALIVGEGTLEGEAAGGLDLGPSTLPRGGEGQLARFDAAAQSSNLTPFHRQTRSDQSWLETSEGKQEYWRREARDRGYFLSREGSEAPAQSGLALAYGPVLVWDLYGRDGSSTSGLDIYDSCTQQHFSIRRNYLHGRLINLEGLQCAESNKETEHE